MMPRSDCVVIGPFIGWKDRRKDTAATNGLQLAARVSQIPRQAVSMAIEVTACASEIPMSGHARVVQKPAPCRTLSGSGLKPIDMREVSERCLTSMMLRSFIKSVEDVQPLPRLIEGQSGWPLTDIDSGLNRTL